MTDDLKKLAKQLAEIAEEKYEDAKKIFDAAQLLAPEQHPFPPKWYTDKQDWPFTMAEAQDYVAGNITKAHAEWLLRVLQKATGNQYYALSSHPIPELLIELKRRTGKDYVPVLSKSTDEPNSCDVGG